MFTKEENFHAGYGRGKLVIEGPTEHLEHLFCETSCWEPALYPWVRQTQAPLHAAGLTPVLTEESSLQGSERFGGVLALSAAACRVPRLHERSPVLASPALTSWVFLGVQWKFLCIGLSCLFCLLLSNLSPQIVRETLKAFWRFRVEEMCALFTVLFLAQMTPSSASGKRSPESHSWALGSGEECWRGFLEASCCV